MSDFKSRVLAHLRAEKQSHNLSSAWSRMARLETSLPQDMRGVHGVPWIGLQSRRPPTEPENPKAGKCYQSPKNTLFLGGPTWHLSDFKMHFWGFWVSGLCRGSARLQGLGYDTPELRNLCTKVLLKLD